MFQFTNTRSICGSESVLNVLLFLSRTCKYVFFFCKYLTYKYVCRACETLAVSVVTNCGSFLQKVAAYFEGCGKKLLKHSDFILRKKRRCRWSPNPELDNWKRYMCIRCHSKLIFLKKRNLFLSHLIYSFSLNSQIYHLFLNSWSMDSWFGSRLANCVSFSFATTIPLSNV